MPADTHPRSQAPLEVEILPSGDVRLRMHGRLDAEGAAAVWDLVQQALQQACGKRLTVDASGITYCNGTGAALMQALARRHEGDGGKFELVDFPDEYEPLLRIFAHADPADTTPRPPDPNVVTMVGRATAGLLRDCASLIAWVGELVLALGFALRHPHLLRWGDVLRVCEHAGVHATPVVVLIGFLIGLVMGFQSALTMRDYGAESYLGRLLGLSILRELGPLMTAIILTARSGSAFAAEIGTMQINEEVAALRAMGMDPMRFLVVPRVVAAVTMTPLLTMFSNAAGLLGGAVVSIFTLGLPLAVYSNAILEAVRFKDLAGGLAKALVFGLLVAAVACIRGLQTSGGATGVGDTTTRAVVSGIVLIALADSLFSFVYYYLGI
jgi:phospholipid/cholesterol/gamma-HCH transport system permease protein